MIQIIYNVFLAKILIVIVISAMKMENAYNVILIIF